MSVNLPISSYIFEIIVTQILYDVKKEKLIVLFAITLTTQQRINLYPRAFFYIKSGGAIVPPVTKFVPPVRKV